MIKDLFIKTGLFSSNDLCDMKPAQAGEGANCGWWLGVGAQRENFNARLQLKMLVLMQCSKLVQVFRQRCFLPRQRVGSYVRTTSISASAKSVKSPAKQKCRIQLGVRPTQSALLKYDIESIHIYIYTNYKHTVTILVNCNSKFHVFSRIQVLSLGGSLGDPKYGAKTKQELHHCWRAINSLDGKRAFNRLIDEGHVIAETSHGVVLQVRRQSRWRTQKRLQCK